MTQGSDPKRWTSLYSRSSQYKAVLKGASAIRCEPSGSAGRNASPPYTMTCMGRHVTKPQSYRQAASEQMLGFFVLCLPYYQSLVLAGMTGMISFLLLTFLLVFVVAHSPAIYPVISACLKAIPPSWITPALDRRDRWVGEPLYAVTPGPSLAPSFQRPPPLFS